MSPNNHKSTPFIPPLTHTTQLHLLPNMQRTHFHRNTVQITVYVVNPRRSTKPVKTVERFSGHHHHHRRRIAAGGSDRKADLLLYSRQLRATSISKPHKHERIKEALTITSKIKQTRIQITGGSTADVLPAASRHINPAFPRKVVPLERKPSPAKLPEPPPSCFGGWKRLLLPAFCVRKSDSAKDLGDRKRKKKLKKKISVSLSNKMNAIMMSSRMEKERIGVMAKFLSAVRKQR